MVTKSSRSRGIRGHSVRSFRILGQTALGDPAGDNGVRGSSGHLRKGVRPKEGDRMKVGGGAAGCSGAHVGNRPSSEAQLRLGLNVPAPTSASSARGSKSSGPRQSQNRRFFTRPVRVAMILSGFGSLCTIPASCAADKPSAITVARPSTRLGRIGTISSHSDLASISRDGRRRALNCSHVTRGVGHIYHRSSHFKGDPTTG